MSQVWVASNPIADMSPDITSKKGSQVINPIADLSSDLRSQRQK